VSALTIMVSQLDWFTLEVRRLSRTEIGRIFEVSERVSSSAKPTRGTDDLRGGIWAR